MGRRKKSCHRKGGAAASASLTASSEATKTSEAKPAEEEEEQEQNNNAVILEQKLASCQLSDESRPWEAYKSLGNNLFGEHKYQEALDQYSLAIEALTSDENAPSNYF